MFSVNYARLRIAPRSTDAARRFVVRSTEDPIPGGFPPRPIGGIMGRAETSENHLWRDRFLLQVAMMIGATPLNTQEDDLSEANDD